MIEIFFGLGLCLILIKWYISRGSLCKERCDLTGNVAVVTGGSNGIGLQTALELARYGCTVIVGDLVPPSKIFEKNITYHVLDLGSRSSIDQFADYLVSSQTRLDILINNAGLIGNASHSKTTDGHEIHFGIHFLGHFYLTYRLWNLLSRSSRVRIVNVSSIAHYCVPKFDLKLTEKFRKSPWDQFIGYSFSKLLVIHMTKKLAKINKKGRVMCVHPGFVATQIMQKLGYVDWMMVPIVKLFFIDSQKGAQASLHCVFQEEQLLENGGYYSGCRLATASKDALSQSLAEQSWDLAESILKVNFR